MDLEALILEQRKRLEDAETLAAEQDPDVPSNWPQVIAQLRAQLLELEAAQERQLLELEEARTRETLSDET